MFGSYVNGFGVKSSDLDITILTERFEDERQFLTKIYTFIK